MTGRIEASVVTRREKYALRPALLEKQDSVIAIGRGRMEPNRFCHIRAWNRGPVRFNRPFWGGKRRRHARRHKAHSCLQRITETEAIEEIEAALAKALRYPVGSGHARPRRPSLSVPDGKLVRSAAMRPFHLQQGQVISSGELTYPNV